MPDEHGAPLEEEYGRVTNPQRYAGLHDAARTLLDRLVAQYRTERVDVSTTDDELGMQCECDTIVGLAPSVDGAAPLTVAFTTFPGLLVRFGLWHVDVFPVCGCDACDEQPDDLIERLVNQVEALVRGNFREEFTGQDLRHEFRLERGSSESSYTVEEDSARSGEPRRLTWAAWTER